MRGVDGCFALLPGRICDGVGDRDPLTPDGDETAEDQA